MKAHGLNGDYCQTCASILTDAIRNRRRMVVLDSQCAQTYQQCGDAALMDESSAKEGGQVKFPNDVEEIQLSPGSVEILPAKPAPKPFKRGGHR